MNERIGLRDSIEKKIGVREAKEYGIVGNTYTQTMV